MDMKFNLSLIIICLYLLSCSVAVVATESDNAYQLLPADEAHRDLEFTDFRAQMIAAVLNKEPEVFVTLIDQRIFNGLKAKRGMKAFLNKWEPDSIDSELWTTLEQILTMGGGFVRSEKGVEFCAPYVFTHFPDDLDIFAHGAVIVDNIALKTEPSVTSVTRRELSYGLLKVLDWVSIQDKSGEGVNWLKVTTMKGENGYVDRRYVRSPSDYSACFLKTKRNGWRLNSLLTSE